MLFLLFPSQEVLLAMAITRFKVTKKNYKKRNILQKLTVISRFL